MTFKACVFDAYGTLFDVSAAARRLAERPGSDALLADRWPALAETWRAKQLEYTWLRALSGRYVDFRAVTEGALDFALERHGLAGVAPRDELMALYERLDAYQEVGAVLETLRARGKPCAILSNGAPEMLAAAAQSAGLTPLLDKILSVDPLKTFKPHPDVYALATAAYDATRTEILFVSSNGWDVCSATAYGFRTVWVNRASAPLDRLEARPDREIADLNALPDILSELESDEGAGA